MGRRISFSSFWQTHPTLFSYRWIKILVTPFRVMMHNPVKFSSVVSRIHSIFPQVNNYGYGTRRIWKMTLNLIMVEKRVLMSLSSICRNSKHLIFVLFWSYVIRLSTLRFRISPHWYNVLVSSSRSLSKISITNWECRKILKLKLSFWLHLMSCHSKEYDFILSPLSRISSCVKFRSLLNFYRFMYILLWILQIWYWSKPVLAYFIIAQC